MQLSWTFHESGALLWNWELAATSFRHVWESMVPAVTFASSLYSV